MKRPIYATKPLPDIVVDYTAEAKQAFDRGLWLGSTVLLGVAAEALLEEAYSALSVHMAATAHKSVFDRELQRVEASAKQRFAVFSTELIIHKSEMSKDLWQRRESLLDTLSNLLKMNRDDVAHRRTTRIDQDAALAAIMSFPALCELTREIIDALGPACSVRR